MATASSQKNSEDDKEIRKAVRKPKVRFESGLSDDDSDSDGDQSVTEADEKILTKEKLNCGVFGRIQKRKMPVRRPTAYVSSKSSNKTKDEEEELEVTGTSEMDANSSNKSLDLEKRLDQLSMKYRKHDRSPEQYDKKPLIKNSGVVEYK